MVSKINLPKLNVKEEPAVTSSVADIFYTPKRQPVSSVVTDIARSLGGLVPSLRAYEDVKEEREITEEEAKADKDFLENNKREFKELVKDGTIQEGANPYYVRQYIKNSLRETSRQFTTELYDEYNKQRIVESENPSAFVDFYKQFSTDFRDRNNLGAYDAQSLAEGFIPYAEATRSQLSNNHIQQRVVQIEKKNIAEIQNFIEKEILTDQDLPEEALDRALSGFNIEGLNYQEKELLYLSQLIQNKIDIDIAEGMNPTVANQTVVDAIIKTAKIAKDEDILLILDNIVTDKGSDSRLAGSFRSEIATALEDIAQIQLIDEKNKAYLEDKYKTERKEDVLNYFIQRPTLLLNPAEAIDNFNVYIAFENEKNKDLIDSGQMQAAPPLSAEEQIAIFNLASSYATGQNLQLIENTEEKQAFVKELNLLLATDPSNPKIIDMIANGWGKYFTTNEGTAYLDKYSSRSKLDGSVYISDQRYSTAFANLNRPFNILEGQGVLLPQLAELQQLANQELTEFFYEILEQFQNEDWLSSKNLITPVDKKHYLFDAMNKKASELLAIIKKDEASFTEIGTVENFEEKKLQITEEENPYG